MVWGLVSDEYATARSDILPGVPAASSSAVAGRVVRVLASRPSTHSCTESAFGWPAASATEKTILSVHESVELSAGERTSMSLFEGRVSAASLLTEEPAGLLLPVPGDPEQEIIATITKRISKRAICVLPAGS